MITVGEAVVLGMVQGLTEFLPVSSSGHLALVRRFMAPLSADEARAVDLALHAGTLLAVVAYFWRDIWGMVRAVGSPRRGGWRFRWIGLLLVATLPVGVAGLALRQWAGDGPPSLLGVGMCFLATGALLYLAAAVRGTLREEETLTARDAIAIGCFQALAVLPGISRAGVTIAGGLFRQLRGDVAVRFAFLMSIPAVVGAKLSEVTSVVAVGAPAQIPLAWGVLASGVTGFAAIWLVFQALRAQHLHYFAYYLWTLGALVVVGTGVFGL